MTGIIYAFAGTMELLVYDGSAGSLRFEKKAINCKDYSHMSARYWSRSALVLFSAFLLAANVAAQPDVDRLADVERSFAKTALEKGTKPAFLEFMSGDAVVFTPQRTLARPYWQARPDSTGALIWTPNYGDISSNGILGYTTGNWEYRAKGKTDQPSAFGEFVTIWLRQPTGVYRWVIDIGVNHPKPAGYSENFVAASYKQRGNPDGISAADSANRFYEMVAKQGLQKAYALYTDQNVRFFRENELPGVGRDALMDRIKKYKGTFVFPKRTVFFETTDMAYVNNTYSFVTENGVAEAGNFVHIWKFIDGKWKIVLDIFKPVPQKAG